MSPLTSTTSTTPCRRLAVTALALPMAFMLSGTALAAGPSGDLQLDQKSAENGSSAADLSIKVGCFTVSAVSDKDISNVKVSFADGGFQEIKGLSGFTFERTFDREIASATAKSGTTSDSGTASGCVTAALEVEDEVQKVEAPKVKRPGRKPVEQKQPVEKPVKDQVPGNGTANVSISVDCFTVSVESDKDISNVKVTFADGDFQEIKGLSGFTFERTFDKPIASATAKSATTSVGDDADDCVTGVTPIQDVTEQPVEKPVEDEKQPVKDEAPVTDEELVCPTVPVTGPVMEGCEPVRETPAEEAPAEETPVDGTPIADQPEPQPATGEHEAPGEAAPIGDSPAPQPANGPAPQAPAEQAPVVVTPILGAPAQAPATGVVGNTAAPATVVAAAAPTQARPTALPFTGADAALLGQLGGLLVLAGGAFVVAGRRERATA